MTECGKCGYTGEREFKAGCWGRFEKEALDA